MKLFLAVALLCLLAVVSCKKVDQQSKEKSHAWSEKKSHNVKKYNQEKAHHHNDKHQKTHLHENPMKHESHSTEKKQHTAEAHHRYHEVPQHEVELQKDIKSTKKEIADRLAKDDQDLHLQDLTHPDDPANAGHKNHKSSHQYQRGHHKTSQHFSHSKGQKASHDQVEDEKLFEESKQPESKQSHPVLEDSFEALNEEIIPEQPDHSQSKKKDSSKNKKSHKKASEKVKEKTKNKENEKKKNKEDKKNKKQQHKGKKEKQQQ